MNFSTFQTFYPDEKLISSFRLDGRQTIQSVILAWSILYSELKAKVLPPLEGDNKRHKINTHAKLKRLHFVDETYRRNIQFY